MRYLSLFSGMEAAHLAWAPLGWQCAAVAEIDPNACRVLAHRLPGVPNLGSVTEITNAQLRALGPLDVVIGGSPCQDLSVAGKRTGLAGARSGLFFEQLRIFHAARTLCGARFLVWENVPGAFSSHAGRDFAVVVGALAGCELAVPADGWGNEGLALGEHGLVEWSVLDAQWFGVAQRRRRVFAVLDTGDWAGRAPVLLEPDGMRGDSAPRREAGQRAAGTLAARTGGGGGLGTDLELDGGLLVAGALTASDGGCDENDARDGRLIVQDVVGALTARGSRNGGQANDDVDGGRLVAFGGNNTAGPIEVTPALLAQPGSGWKGDFDSETFLVDDVAHTLRAGGFDASEDGTGRGTPLVPVAFSCKDHGADAGEIAPTLRSMGHDGSHANAGGQVAVAFVQNQRDEVRTMDVAGARAAEPGAKQQTYLQQGVAVRRLTPRECERLQGAEDDWTLVPVGKGRMKDGPRYKMCGNSFAVPVIHWIGVQLMRAVAQGAAHG